MANAFKTGTNGLPLFDTYNNGSYADGDAVFLAGTALIRDLAIQ
ncbi:hypothetical protein [Sphingobacterium sp. E70]|nr:hypothetical protein [Sphingobacterium sp. E70]